MTPQALPPKQTNRVYMHGRSDSHHFAWADLDLLSGLPVLMRGRFLLCVEAPCSQIYFSKPRWAVAPFDYSIYKCIFTTLTNITCTGEKLTVLRGMQDFLTAMPEVCSISLSMSNVQANLVALNS